MAITLTCVLLVSTLLGKSMVAQAESLEAAAPSPAKTVVVAELFTSEGCSSCPAADALLADLARQQPIAGVEVLALAEHVDYWDRLGWRDRFSSAAFSARQTEYGSRVFRTNQIYTPQLVVDGRLEMVGSDRPAILEAIQTSAQSRKANVIVNAAVLTRERREARVDVRIDVPDGVKVHGSADVVLAIVEDNLSTDVRRGENRGRTLRHDGVVRSLTRIGEVKRDARSLVANGSAQIATDSNSENLRAVIFLQDRDSLRILGASSARLAPEPRLR
jgi:hypothetical protein